MKRNFSSRERRYLFLLSGGICEICGCKLTRSFHADHKIPFSRGGTTTLRNGQALCQTCNLNKSAKI